MRRELFQCKFDWQQIFAIPNFAIPIFTIPIFTIPIYTIPKNTIPNSEYSHYYLPLNDDYQKGIKITVR